MNEVFSQCLRDTLQLIAHQVQTGHLTDGLSQGLLDQICCWLLGDERLHRTDLRAPGIDRNMAGGGVSKSRMAMYLPPYRLGPETGQCECTASASIVETNGRNVGGSSPAALRTCGVGSGLLLRRSGAGEGKLPARQSPQSERAFFTYFALGRPEPVWQAGRGRI